MNKFSGFWIIILAIFSTGCSSIVKAEQPAVLDSVVLSENNSVGQTFNARFDGMNGVVIYLEPLKSGDGDIRLQLKPNALDSNNLAVVSLPVTEISEPGFIQFNLPLQAQSNQQNYYLLLRVIGSGSVRVATAPGVCSSLGGPPGPRESRPPSIRTVPGQRPRSRLPGWCRG